LSQLQLIEVSLVTFPMQPLARVLGVSQVAEGDDA
jgi:phage head maturation protease